MIAVLLALFIYFAVGVLIAVQVRRHRRALEQRLNLSFFDRNADVARGCFWPVLLAILAIVVAGNAVQWFIDYIVEEANRD